MSTNETHTRNSLPGNMIKELKYQIQSLRKIDLSDYTYERTKSHYKGAKTDFTVFDSAGKLVLNGRGFGDRNFFWTPTTDPRLAVS